MNITNTLQTGFSARLFAAVTIVSLLLSAFPVAFFVAQAAVQNVTIDVSMVPTPADGADDSITFSNPAGFSVTLENLVISDTTQTPVLPAQDIVIPANGEVTITVTNRLNAAADTITFSGTNVVSGTPISYSGSPAEGTEVIGSFVITADDGVVVSTVIDPSVTSSSFYTTANDYKDDFTYFAVDFEMNDFKTVTSITVDAYRSVDSTPFASLTGKPDLITFVNVGLINNPSVSLSAPFPVSPVLTAAQRSNLSGAWILPDAAWSASDTPEKIKITVVGTNVSDDEVSKNFEISNFLNDGSASRPTFAELFPAVKSTETIVVPEDTQRPVIVVDSPANGVVVGSDFVITVTATDDVALNRVILNLRNTTGGHMAPCLNVSAGGAASFTASCTVDVDALAEGTYSFRTNTTDLAGNTSQTLTQTFIVDKTRPVIVVNNPADNLMTGAGFDIGVTATDAYGIGKVVINIKDALGAHLGTCLNEIADGSTSYTTNCTISLTDWADGTYQFKTNALDIAGNISNTITQTYTINTNRPTIVVNSPTDVLTTDEDFDISVTATDDTGIARVVINIKDESGAHLGTCLNEVADGSTPYSTSCTIDVDSLSDGVYYFRTNARDVNGNLSNTINRQFVVGRVLTSTVTMCKYDEQQNSLSGWQLALLGDKVRDLAVTPDGTTQSMTAIPAGQYVLKASGAYGYGNGGRFSDARFSDRGAAGWVNTNTFAPAVKDFLSLQVNNDGAATWGNTFSPSHVYYGALTQATAGNVDLKILDDNYDDNSGSIEVTLHTGRTGVTGDDGCVVFEDVPYGTYQVEELLQGGFTNTSGLISVTVDSETETFNVVNNDLSFVPQCKLDIYSDTTTLVKDTNSQAVATYSDNDRWTANIANAIWVWATGEVANPETEETYTFVETFTVTNPTAANINIAHDNWLTLTINDTVIVRDQNGYQDFQDYDESILNVLVSGTNRIEMEVTNKAQNNGSYRSNPAGALFHISVEGDNDSCMRTTEPAFSSLTIDNPAVDAEVLSGSHTFMSTYKDFDNDEDEVFWAIRAGSCNGTDLIGNTPQSPFGPSTFDDTTGAFETTVDMSTWTNGDYCLVVNPREDSGAPDERETRVFTLDNSTAVNPQPNTFRISGYKWEDENGNGLAEESESVLNNWTMFLSEEGSDAAPVEVLTAGEGEYFFEVGVGTWTVTEKSRENWTQTGQFQNGDPVASTSEAFGSCTFTISEDADVEFYTCSFGNQEDVDPIDPEEPIDPQEPVDETSTRSGGGGGSTRVERVAQPMPLVLGATTDAPQFCPFLVDFQQMGATNDPVEVMKLQLFLNVFKDVYGGTENPVTGTFGEITDRNVKAFQETYRSEILDPWYNAGIVPHNRPTGFVYKTTLWKINSMVCPDTAVLPDLSEESLDAYVDIDAAPVKD